MEKFEGLFVSEQVGDREPGNNCRSTTLEHDWCGKVHECRMCIFSCDNDDAYQRWLESKKTEE